MLPRHGEPFQLANKCSFQPHKIMYLMHSSLLSTIYALFIFSSEWLFSLGWILSDAHICYLFIHVFILSFSLHLKKFFFKFTFDFIFYNFHVSFFLPLQIFISILHFYFLKFFYFNQFHFYLCLHFNLVSPYDFAVLRLRKGHLTFY